MTTLVRFLRLSSILLAVILCLPTSSALRAEEAIPRPEWTAGDWWETNQHRFTVIERKDNRYEIIRTPKGRLAKPSEWQLKLYTTVDDYTSERIDRDGKVTKFSEESWYEWVHFPLSIGSRWSFNVLSSTRTVGAPERMAPACARHRSRSKPLSTGSGSTTTYSPIPLPAAVMEFLQAYVQRVLSRVETIGPETPLFWSTWGRRVVGKTRAPMIGKNIWRLCKVYGRIIGYPELKPHDLRHGVAMEVLEQHHDLEQVRALLGHARIDTTQIYTSIRPAQLKRVVSFYEEKALQMLSE